MKNLAFILTFLFTGWSVSASVNSTTATNYNNYNDSFIFIEEGVEFAVYPNGEFDFYFNPDFRRRNVTHISSPNVNISYNSGYNYNPYVQYDDYGAVIQIENVPVYYDYYGRIIQAGNVLLRYNNFGRLAQVGNLHIHYNRHHHFTHYSGFINHYNRQYIYRPWHSYYRRPHTNVSIVFNRPYRAYYQPHRISYNKYVTVYNNYYIENNGKRNFYRPSDRIRSYNYGTKTTSRRDLSSTRSNIAYSREDVNRSYSDRDLRSNIENSSRRNYSEDYNRSTISRSVNNQTYGASRERSTNSRGRTIEIDNGIEKRQLSRERAPQRNEARSSSSIQRRSNAVKTERPAARTRSFESSSRSSSARNSAVQRPTRQNNPSVRSRGTSGTSRSEGIRIKNSSESRSSARNMNNIR